MLHRLFDRSLSVAVLLCLASCSGPPPPPAATDATPKRIVSLAPALTEILFALDLGPRVVGVTQFCDWPPQVATLPRVGGYSNPSVEAILALQPDLVLVSPNVSNKDGALALERAGLRLGVIRSETLEETFTAIAEVGRLCGATDRAQQLEAEVRQRIERAAARVRGRPPVRTLFCLEVDPMIVVGKDTLPGQLLELAGGVNVVDAPRYPRIGIEAVVAAAPAVIVQTRMDVADPEVAAKAGAYWRRWRSIPAVRSGRLFVVDASPALRPGPRVGVAVEQLAAILHPEATAKDGP